MGVLEILHEALRQASRREAIGLFGQKLTAGYPVGRESIIMRRLVLEIVLGNGVASDSAQEMQAQVVCHLRAAQARSHSARGERDERCSRF